MTNKLVLDMNQRERDRFIEVLTALAGVCNAAVEALRNEDDADFFAQVFIFGMTGPQVMKELVPVLTAAQTVSTDDLDKPFGFGPDKEDNDG